MINPRKVAIVGMGNVGASCAFALMQKKLYSEMVLINRSRDKAEGEAMDLSDGLPYVGSMKIYAGDYEDAADASLIVITSGGRLVAAPTVIWDRMQRRFCVQMVTK